MKSTSAQRAYWAKYHQDHKHDPAFRARRQARHKTYRKRHVFQQLVKAQRKEHGVDIPRVELWRICLRQKCKCALTGRKLTRENISLDHIVPVCRGGSLDVSNLRLVVKEANQAKHRMLDAELYQLCSDLLGRKSSGFA